MKFYVNHHYRSKLFGLFFIFLIFVNQVNCMKMNLASKRSDPGEIVGLNESTETDARVDIDVNENDPLEYMRRKQELINLYFGGAKKKQNNRRLRFKQVVKEENENKANGGSYLTTKPSAVSKMGEPTAKEYTNDEEVVKIVKATSRSVYVDLQNQGKSYDPMNILKDEGSFWCSEGSHDYDAVVNFDVEFDKPYRLSAYWLQWAFAPGQYRISYANKREEDGTILFMPLTPNFKDSIKGGDTNWWKSIIADQKTRWKYKSFDERVNLDQPTWARYIRIEMRLPVNQYFGIYKLEFYTRANAVVMLKSRKPGENSCLSVVNGQIADNSPVVMIDCLQGISYGDNRDLFVIHSNGFITTYKDNKCLQSPSQFRVDVLDCGKSSNFKDDREKWMIEHDGKIRSSKEEFTCLSVTDFSVKDEIPLEDMKVTASSTQNDGVHNAERALGDDINSYWASNLTINEVVFEIVFSKHPYFVKDMSIEWKFPAKSFTVIGLYPDGYWRIFAKKRNNRQTTTLVNFQNKDLNGIRISMTEASMKLEEKFVYGIKNISIHTGSRFLRRDPCGDILMDSNKFEIIDVSILDQTTGNEFKKAKAGLHQTRTKLRLVQTLYSKIPDTLLSLKEGASNLTEKLKSISQNFTDLQLKLSKFEDFINSEEVKIFTLAANPHTPAYDCAHLIKAFPSKRSGFYWIKNECMPAPQKVYCDFDLYDKKGGLDYLIFNDNQQVNSPFKKKFRNVNDIRYKCYELGLEPLEIKNERMLKNVYFLLKILNYDLNTDSIVPIGYDYNCDVSKCSKMFKSLNDISSGDISDVISIFNDEHKTGLNNLFSSLTEIGSSDKNIAAFGKLGSIVYEKLSVEKVSAIVCSTNQDGSKIKKNYIDVDCKTNLKTEEFSKVEVFSSLRMNCPSDCAKEKNSIVYGSDVYTDNSSVCRAAVHSGAKKDGEEAIIEVHFEPGREKYNGSERYSVTTLDLADKWNRSFSVKKYNPYCPLDKLKEYNPDEEETESPSSFLELSNETMMEENEKMQKLNKSQLEPMLEQKVKEAELLQQIQGVITNYKFLVEQDRSLITSNKHRELVSKLGEISRFLQGDLTNKAKDYDKGQTGPGLLDQMKSALNNNNDSNPNSLANNSLPYKSVLTQDQINSVNENNRLALALKKVQEKIRQQNAEKDMKKFLNFEIPTENQTTEIALTYFSAILTGEKNQLSEIKKVSDDFKGIIGKTVAQTETLNVDRNIGVITQQAQINDFEAKTKLILKFIYEIDRKIQNKLKQTEFQVKELKDRINFFNIREPFTEDYNNKNIYDNWDLYLSKKGKGVPTEWEYFQYFINGHSKVMQQKGAFMDNRSGAHLILKYRDYYDFEFKCSFMLKDNNTFGIAFRYRDPYNYYIFEVSKLEGGRKKIRKFMKGIGKDIDVKNDGGFMTDIWYNVKIRAIQSEFKIYMTDYNGPELDSHYELIFQFTDNEIIHGTIAFASMGIGYLLIDNVSVVPIMCRNFDDSSQAKVIALTPTCSRFRETFLHGFNSRWLQIDPLDSINGPSTWKTLNDVDQREVVLAQLSNISGTSENQEGTIFLLNDPTKICNQGRFIIELKALDEGIVGLVFRFDYSQKNPQGDFYILEVSGFSDEKFIRIRKRINGKYTLVSSNPTLGYTKNSWFKIILTLENNAFNAFITETSSQDNIIQVFSESVIDDDIKFGMMGISTFKTKVVIDEIILSPYDNLDTNKLEEEDLVFYVDEEELDLPKNKLKEKTIFDRVNTHIKNFSWSKCLVYPIHEERQRYCNVLFSSQVQISNCKSNFCQSCCDQTVDNTNKEHQFLCNKQCEAGQIGTNKKTWNSCIESSNPETSVYPYCDQHFKHDYFSRQRCKVDMCNLCCISMDHIHIPLYKDEAVNTCYMKCAKTFAAKNSPQP